MQRIKKAYAENGDLKIIPDTPPLDGSENWEQGRGAYYELDNDPNTGDPLALDIDREQDNYFKNVISKNIKHWQENSYPIYFDDIEYPKNAIVKYTDGILYTSKVDNNATLPTDTANWTIYDPSSLESLLAELADDIWIKPPSRLNKPLFTKVNPHSISIPDGFKVAVNKKIINLTSDYVLSLNSDLDTGTKTAGTDYYVYAKDDETFYLSANNAITVDKLIGGFHYGLTGETELRPANALKTEADMIANRGIKAYSMWDLTWKPANKRPEGKVLVNNLFWRDIYPADEDYGIRGYSSCFALDGVTPAKIAGGAETNGRKFPKIPLTKGGNGTLNYGSLTWFEANEIISEVGMRMISYDEFSNSSYGVVEQKSLKDLGYPLGTGVIQHYPELESKWGVEMAVGVQWTWTKELMNGYGSTDFANRTGLTDGRGYIYATSNSPVAGICGGQEEHTASTVPVGSRALALGSYVWVTHWADGFVAVCNHINLDK